VEDDALEGHRRGEYGHGVQEVLQGHPGPGQGHAHVGRFQWTGADSEKHADLAASSGRAAKSGHQRPPLAAIGGRYQGQLRYERGHQSRRFVGPQLAQL